MGNGAEVPLHMLAKAGSSAERKGRGSAFSRAMEPLLDAAPVPQPADGSHDASPVAHPRKKYRSWKNKTDDEIVEMADAFIAENKIRSRSMLWAVDAGLADRLRKRGLWDRISFTGAGPNMRPQRRAEKSAAGGMQGQAEQPAVEKSEPICSEDIVFLAQSAIDDAGLSSLDELEILDPEICGLVRERGLCGSLRFRSALPAEEGPAEAAPALLGLRAEELRKSDLRGLELGEREMFGLILAECFRLGTGGPYIGNSRCTVPKLQSNMNRKLGGPQHRVFRKCWDRMVAEGVIVYNQNSSAASLDIDARIRDGALREAVGWAIGQQMDVSREWRARLDRHP
ncbi:MAG: hypothetical protein U0R44_05240 [Candidatus Micrarchaeia archaeon]